jgi:hypothetical protein
VFFLSLPPVDAAIEGKEEREQNAKKEQEPQSTICFTRCSSDWSSELATAIQRATEM